VINPDGESAKRLPTRYADYPLRRDDVFRLDTPGGGFGDPFEREPERVLADVREGYVSREAAEKHYGVVVAETETETETEDGLTVAAAATARKRNKETP
jgi:N-methylhydantoinase B/oxoprolinase/acetone carboxylase alpha subunit